MSKNETLDVMFGTQIVDFMNRDDITEIYVNDDGYVRYMSHKEGKVKTDIILKPEKILAIIELIAGQVGKLTYSPCLKAGDSWIQTILAY